MAQMTIDLDSTHHSRADVPAAEIQAADDARVPDDERHSDRLRSTLPALVAVLLLVGVGLAGAIVLRDLASFGLWFAGQF
ncbi:hypothetical protein [Actinotalea sp. JY-7876]|uniref:hypothetical protein n=1 Tax=Actinotalea sp. JY-7876 TaxID=2758442 RepID=UPI0015F37909|nr:hypothetical protein [Actinotalea sp. JY-7876]